MDDLFGIPTERLTLVLLAIFTAGGLVLASGIYALRSGWDALVSSWASAVASFAIVGFSMILVSRLILTVREQIRAEITDDGLGVPSKGDETYPSGSGLSGLAERVAANYGRFEAGSPPAGGFRLHVSLPLGTGTKPSTGPASGAGVTRRDKRP